MEQLNLVNGVDFPSSQFWFGTIITTVQFMAYLCSNLFIVSMTFDRFYSIINLIGRLHSIRQKELRLLFYV